MCGICGIVNYKNRPAQSTLIAMIAALDHRGPDESGFTLCDSAVLGHSRLSIIDLVNGQQPLTVAGSGYWISYNGEIFNYVELREELKSLGAVFETQCDTEVVLQAYLYWGKDCFRRFNGQFAFAIWNSNQQTLILARDRFGIRPLYYYKSNQSFSFASEIKSLFQNHQIPREFDPKGLEDTYRYWGPVAPRTVFKDIYELPPGSFAEFSTKGFSTSSYWELEFGEHGSESVQNFEDAVNIFRQKLEKSVSLRFNRSDVAVASYLSGGIDSTVIASLVTRITNKKLDTFSLRFSDSQYDEGSFQQSVAEQIGSNHHEIMVSSRDIGEVFADVVNYTERPVLRTAPAPMFLLSKLVQTGGYKVVVTGEGADEMLGGYDIFREILVRQFLANNPESACRKDLLKCLYPWMVNTPGGHSGMSTKFFLKEYNPQDPGVSHRPRWSNGKGILQLLNPDFTVDSSLSTDFILPEIKIPDQFNQWGTVEKAQWWEIKTLLSGYLLSAQGDRMLMGNSIEGRFPFLDPELADFCFTLPSRFKVMGLNEKALLKHAYKNEIPDMVFRRPKQPYRSPDAAAFRSLHEFEWANDLLSESFLRQSGIFKPKAVELMVKKVKNNSGGQFSNVDNMRVSAILSTLVLQKNFIDNIPFKNNMPRTVPQLRKESLVLK